jgi:hypothetical protein
MFHNRIPKDASTPPHASIVNLPCTPPRGFVAIPLEQLPAELNANVQNRADIYRAALEQAQIDALFHGPGKQ